MSLFHPKVIDPLIDAAPLAIPESHRTLLEGWAATIRDRSIRTQGEVPLHGPFTEQILVGVLGYRGFGSGPEWTVAGEESVGKGFADRALGRFSAGERHILAPFELKGAKTHLDAIMPDRHKTPVQQAWEYAMDSPGSEWVLVSNYVELRLYAVGYGRDAYESFDLVDLVEPRQYRRFQLLLGADSVLSGRTRDLLERSDEVEKEITSELYGLWRTILAELIADIRAHNPAVRGEPSVDLAQSVLDRILFVAFAEDRGLLEERRLLDRAWRERSAFNPQPLFDNFRGIFRSIHDGNDALGIPAYGGEIFAPDPEIDALVLSDGICARFQELGEYDFGDEASVRILGHLFEQSIADLETLRREAAGELRVAPAGKQGTRGRRKREGVVYTPDHVAATIVDLSLGAYLDEAFEQRLAEATHRSVRADDGRILWRSRSAEVALWRGWREFLGGLKVVDPACGSGAFLVAAFDHLAAAFERVNRKLEELTGSRELFDPDRTILSDILYGVDVNRAAVHISRLSLWLKTASVDKPLASLEHTLRVGNSLIDDPQWTEQPFDWETAFPEVFAGRGGFDVVIGNPPYVRMEHLKAFKPYLKEHYEVAAERADLYTYFFELGHRLMRPGGALGYICAAGFYKINGGGPLRTFLSERTTLQTLIEFGDVPVFEGVNTAPSIVVARKRIAEPEHAVRFLQLGTEPVDDLVRALAQDGAELLQQELRGGSWNLQPQPVLTLRRRLAEGRPTVGEVYGAPVMGLKTGRDVPFELTGEQRAELAEVDPGSLSLIVPYAKGRSLQRWIVDREDLWLIYTPRGEVDIRDHPGLEQHLLPFRDSLEKRSTRQAYWELQQAQAAYRPVFEGPKITYPMMSRGPKFSLDRQGLFSNQNTYVIDSDDLFVVGLLNSRAAWFFLSGVADALRGGVWRLTLYSSFVAQVPVPSASAAQREPIERAVAGCHEQAAARSGHRRRVLRRLAREAGQRPSSRLQRFWTLEPTARSAELDRLFGRKLGLVERDEWDEYLDAGAEAIRAASLAIAAHERELDEAFFELFGLDEGEQQLLTSTIGALPPG